VSLGLLIPFTAISAPMTHPDLHALVTEMADELDFYRQCLTDDRTRTHPLARAARAYLAEPQQVAPSDEELNGMWDAQDFKFPGVVANFGRAVLAHYGSHPVPVPVAERLPEDGYLDGEGTCWCWHSVSFHWCRCRPDSSVHTYLLPHWELPLPLEAQP
jgi:hypothetical protein